MDDVSRRIVIKGALAAAAVAAAPAIAAGASTAATWVPVEPQTWTLQYIVRFATQPVYEPRHEAGDTVQVKFREAGDRRSFKAQSIKPTEGRVMLVIPGGAMPWRYTAGHLRDAPAKFKTGLSRSAQFRRRSPGPRYVIGTSKGYSVASAQQMRAMASPSAIRDYFVKN